MQADYRNLFLTALEGLDGSAAGEMRKFAAGKPTPCWGAIYKRFGELFTSEDALRMVIDRFCATPGCDRFLLLVLHLNRESPEVVKLFATHLERLPVLVQSYLVCMPSGAEAVKATAKMLPPELADLPGDPRARAREREFLLAKISKLLRYEWAPIEEHHENHGTDCGNKPAGSPETPRR
ncbi:MAG: hypothetical protein HY897_15980 [Deltaproteobacteria bacterium]|nr:hypothetical protein [Deltaproteobacteria bacterium]